MVLLERPELRCLLGSRIPIFGLETWYFVWERWRDIIFTQFCHPWHPGIGVFVFRCCDALFFTASHVRFEGFGFSMQRRRRRGGGSRHWMEVVLFSSSMQLLLLLLLQLLLLLLVAGDWCGLGLWVLERFQCRNTGRRVQQRG